MKRLIRYFGVSAVVAGLILSAAQSQAVVFSGNGNTGFGGAIGTGSLTLVDNGTTISGTITRGSGDFNDALVIYIDSVGGGFSSTSTFDDTGDGLRKAISGFDGSNRSALTFDSGFSPDYVLAIGPNNASFGGLWSLAGTGSHGFIASLSLSPTGTGTAASYSFSFLVSDIGLTPNSGATFGLLGTYISDSGFRSTEAVAGNVSGTQGWNAFTQTATASYTIVPEPTTFGLVGIGVLGAWFIRRRKV